MTKWNSDTFFLFCWKYQLHPLRPSCRHPSVYWFVCQEDHTESPEPFWLRETITNIKFKPNLVLIRKKWHIQNSVSLTDEGFFVKQSFFDRPVKRNRKAGRETGGRTCSRHCLSLELKLLINCFGGRLCPYGTRSKHPTTEHPMCPKFQRVSANHGISTFCVIQQTDRQTDRNGWIYNHLGGGSRVWWCWELQYDF